VNSARTGPPDLSGVTKESFDIVYVIEIGSQTLLHGTC
jgi:hypothetical protein